MRLFRFFCSGKNIHFISLLLILLIFLIFSPVLGDGGLSGEISEPLALTPAEKDWITAHPVIRVGPDNNYPPFEMISSNGKYQGISADILELVVKKTGLKLEIVPCKNWTLCVEKIKNREIDILGAVYISDMRSEYLAYSEPIYTSPLQIITKKTAPSDLTLDALAGKTVAVVDGYTSHFLLVSRYPTIHTVVVSDIPSGLEKVVFGSVDAYVGDLATAAYHVDKSGFANLQVSGKILDEGSGFQDLAFGIRSDQPELVSILNKGLVSLSRTEKNEIFSRWIPSSLTPPLISPQVLSAMLGVLVLCLFIILGFILWNRSLKRAVADKTSQLVHELNERKKIQIEIMSKNDELSAANEQLKATESEMRTQYHELIEVQKELQIQERALRQVRFSIDQSHDMMIWLDNNGLITDVSGSVTTSLGFDRTELRSMNISIIDPTFVIEAGLELLGLDHQGQVRYETEFICKDGTPVPVEVALLSYEYSDETRILISARDISEQKQMEELKKKAFTQIDKNIEHFAILNDQIRNPLTLLMIYAEEMSQPDAEKILFEIDRIDKLVDKLDKGLLESEKVRAFLRRYYTSESESHPFHN